MKTVGIIGGIGPESTIEYYRRIIAAYREQRPDGSYPAIITNSIDMNKMLGMAGRNELAALADYLAHEVQKLIRAGADFALFASNTPHIVFEEVRRRSSIPLISIVEAACDAAKGLGLKKLGLFGTRLAMQGKFYPDVFSKAGIALVVPSVVEQDYIHGKYFGELVHGTVLAETHAGLVAIASRMKEQESIEGLVLGGTELSIILREATVSGIPVLDTTQIHVDRIVAQLLA